MSRRFTSAFELLLLLVVLISLGLGVNWTGNNPAYATQPTPLTPAPDVAQKAATPQEMPTETPPPTAVDATAPPSATETEVVLTSTVVPAAYPAMTGTLGLLPTSAVIDPKAFLIEPGDAPLLVQAPGTMNVLLLGSDNSTDPRYSRTDTLMVASINPDMPSVSLLSFPRDLQVRIPNHADDRINTAYEYGYMTNYPGGGPAFLALVLRKNFGIKIDHYVRVNFSGFVNIVDQLGGVQVIAECELHDTFPDPSSVLNGTRMRGTVDLDVYPGKVNLDGYKALMYSRSRESTTDFDRARRQQKVLRALFSKVKSTNLLANAIPLFEQTRQSVDTDMGLASVPAFVDIASRLDNLAIKNRVITYPVVKSIVRKDGAMVLQANDTIYAYVRDSLSPPAGNRAQNRINVEVVNASGRKDMEAVAADRLTWEGFFVTSATVADSVEANTQIVDFTTTPKGSPIPRLDSIFNVRQAFNSSQPDPNATAVAQVILGKDYNSCPPTANIAADVNLGPANHTDMIPTSTPQGVSR
jgi:LCP family protein required for cell wall assembly